MNKFHTIKNIHFDNDSIIIEIDGKEHKFPLQQYSKKLLNASDTQRQDYKISPSGYGLHWPAIDEDLSIDGLLGIKHQPDKSQKVS